MNTTSTYFKRLYTFFNTFSKSVIFICYMILEELKKLGKKYDSTRPETEILISKVEFCNILQTVALRYSHNTFAAKISDKHTHWQLMVQGAMAEFAVAKYLNVLWKPETTKPDSAPDIGDIGKHLQVRSTGLVDGCLLIKPTDENLHMFVLVIGDANATDFPARVNIVGCMVGRDCKKVRWQKDGSDTYFVPQSELMPVNKMALMAYL